jgi:hypothetical protein
VRRAALALVLLTGACAATPTPTRDELAHALGSRAPAASTDLTHIACEPAKAGEVACRWRQRDERQWQDWQGHLALAGDNWQLVDTPTRRP